MKKRFFHCCPATATVAVGGVAAVFCCCCCCQSSKSSTYQSRSSVAAAAAVMCPAKSDIVCSADHRVLPGTHTLLQPAIKSIVSTGRGMDCSAPISLFPSLPLPLPRFLSPSPIVAPAHFVDGGSGSSSSTVHR